MGQFIAVLGDGSDHGGTIVTATGFMTIKGKKVAVDRDLHSCPIHGHGLTSIVSTTTLTSTNGKHVIRNGDQAACGAKIIAQTFGTSG